MIFVRLVIKVKSSKIWDVKYKMFQSSGSKLNKFKISHVHLEKDSMPIMKMHINQLNYTVTSGELIMHFK